MSHCYATHFFLLICHCPTAITGRAVHGLLHAASDIHCHTISLLIMLTVLQEAVSIRDIDTTFLLTNADGVFKITVGDLYAEEKKDLLVRLQVND